MNFFEGRKIGHQVAAVIAESKVALRGERGFTANTR
jgi:hypothetical protein